MKNGGKELSRKTMLPSIPTRTSSRLSDSSIADIPTSQSEQGKNRSRARTFMGVLRHSYHSENSTDGSSILNEDFGSGQNLLGTEIDEDLMLLCYGKANISMKDMSSVECDIDLSVSELSNALRALFSKYLKNDQFSKRLSLLFNHFDKNHDQRIQYDEFSTTIKTLFKINLEETIIKQLIATLDTSSLGYIDWSTFMSFFKQMKSRATFSTKAGNVVTCVSLSKDASTLAYGGLFGVAVVKENHCGENQVVFQRQFKNAVEAVALNSAGTELFVGELKSEGNIYCIDVSSKDSVDVKMLPFPCEQVWSLALGPHDEILVVGGRNPNICRLYAAKTATILCDIEFPVGVKSVALARPGSVTVNLAKSCLNKRTVTCARERLHVLRDENGVETLILNLTDSNKLPQKYRKNKTLIPFKDDKCALPLSVLYSGSVRNPYSSFGNRTITVTVDDFEENGVLEALVLDPATTSCEVSSYNQDLVSEQQQQQQLKALPVEGTLAEAVPEIEASEKADREGKTQSDWSDLHAFDIFKDLMQPHAEDYRTMKANTKVLVELHGTIACLSSRFVVAITGDEGSLLVVQFLSCASGTLADTLALPGAPSESNIGVAAAASINNARDMFLKNGLQIGEVHVSEPVTVSGFIDTVALSSDGSTIAMIEGKNVFVSKTNELNEITQKFSFSEKVLTLSLTETGHQVAVGGEDCRVQVFDVASGVPLLERVSSDFIKSVALSSDGQSLAYGGMSRSVHHDATVSGVQLRPIPFASSVNCVSLSSDSNRFAAAYDSTVSIHCRTPERGFIKIRSWKHSQCVKVVKISSQGDICCSGDDSGHIVVRDIDRDVQLFLYRFRATEQCPPFIWAIDISEDGTRLAAGSWNSEVRVWSTSSWRPLCPVLERKDRIYSLKLSQDGRLMVSGDRSGTVSVWEVGDLQTRATTLLFELELPNRVYSVALSSDNKLIAIGGLFKEIWIIETSTKKISQRLKIDAALSEGSSNLDFDINGRALVAGLSNKSISVWMMDHNESLFHLFLLLPRKHRITAVSFSSEVLVASVGTKIILYGEPSGVGPIWYERPDFEVLSELLDSNEATRTILHSFPSISNARSIHTGESIIQRCCRMHKQETLQILLQQNPKSQVGFVRDNSGMNPLKAAILLEKKNSIKALLETVSSGRVSSTASSLQSVSECFVLLSSKFPRLFLDFICSMPLLEEPKYTAKYNPAKAFLPGDNTFFGTNFLVRGTGSGGAEGTLWEPELSLEANDSVHFLLSIFFSNAKAGVKSEVISSRVVFENFAGRYMRWSNSPLHLITAAAYREKRMDVFKSPMVMALLEFKWNTYAHRLYLITTAIYIVYLFAVIISSISASRSLQSNCTLKDLFYGECDNDVSIAMFLFPFCIACSLSYLQTEVIDLISEGWIYFTKNSNRLDIPAFTLQILSSVFWALFRTQYPDPAAILLAGSVLVLMFKLIFYFRGIPRLSALLRIVFRIIEDIRLFLFVIFLIIFTFSVGLMIVNGRDVGGELFLWKFTDKNSEQWLEDCSDLEWEIDGHLVSPEERLKLCSGSTWNTLFRYVQFVMNTALYGTRGDTYLEAVRPNALNLIFFHLMLISIQIIFLNLIISIMGHSFSQVKENEIIEGLYEKADIIRETETAWVDTYVNVLVFKKKVRAFLVGEEYSPTDLDIYGEFFPRWLHVLSPGAFDDTISSSVSSEKFDESESAPTSTRHIAELKGLVEQLSERLAAQSDSAQVTSTESTDTRRMKALDEQVAILQSKVTDLASELVETKDALKASRSKLKSSENKRRQMRQMLMEQDGADT